MVDSAEGVSYILSCWDRSLKHANLEAVEKCHSLGVKLYVLACCKTVESMKLLTTWVLVRLICLSRGSSENICARKLRANISARKGKVLVHVVSNCILPLFHALTFWRLSLWWKRSERFMEISVWKLLRVSYLGLHLLHSLGRELVNGWTILVGDRYVLSDGNALWLACGRVVSVLMDWVQSLRGLVR